VAQAGGGQIERNDPAGRASDPPQPTRSQYRFDVTGSGKVDLLQSRVDEAITGLEKERSQNIRSFTLSSPPPMA